MPVPALGTLSQPLPGGQAPGAAAPMGAAPSPATPQASPEGQRTVSRAKVMKAIQQISQELPNFPVGSEEHTALMDSIKKLGKYFSGWSAPTATPQPQQAAQQIQGSSVPLPPTQPQQEAA